MSHNGHSHLFSLSLSIPLSLRPPSFCVTVFLSSLSHTYTVREREKTKLRLTAQIWFTVKVWLMERQAKQQPEAPSSLNLSISLTLNSSRRLFDTCQVLTPRHLEWLVSMKYNVIWELNDLGYDGLSKSKPWAKKGTTERHGKMQRFCSSPLCSFQIYNLLEELKEKRRLPTDVKDTSCRSLPAAEHCESAGSQEAC